MIKYILVLLTALMVQAMGNADPITNEKNTMSAEYSWLSEIVSSQPKLKTTPAIGVAIVGPEGVLAIHTQGLRTARGSDNVTQSDMWHLGSCTKAMTALLYADLVEQGKTSWGATIPDLFPDIADQIDASWTDTTVEDLLDHTSGVGDINLKWLLARRSDERPITEQRYEDAVRTFSAPPKGNPDTFEYSNLNYILVGAAIERITEQSWEEAFREHKPGQLMGESGWGFGPPQGDNPIGHKKLLGFFLPVGQNWNKADNPAALGPAGTVHASLESWAGFVSAFLKSSDKLSEETKKHLTSIHQQGGDYALGWGRHTIGDDIVIGHSGSNTMWFSDVLIIPAKDRAILVVTNSATPSSHELVQSISKSVRTKLLENTSGK